MASLNAMWAAIMTAEDTFTAAPESPARQLWRMRELQADARRRGWDCADVDEWLAQNADGIEADCQARYERMV